MNITEPTSAWVLNQTMIFHLYQFLFKVLHLSRQYHQALSLTCHFPPSQDW